MTTSSGSGACWPAIEAAELKTFWHQQLQGELPVTELPFSRVRPAVQGYRGASCRFQIDSAVTKLISGQARELGVSLNSMLLAGFEILIHRYTWQQEITIGTPVSGQVIFALGPNSRSIH